MTKKKLLNPFILDDWTSDSLEVSWNIISNLATEKYQLTYYKPSFEVVNFEDMLHIYTGSLPIMYSHWSFGKSYMELHKRYMADRMGVAYEVIFNTNPALCYLLEHNSPTMQGLVLSHAAIGHSSFFRNNVLFKEMTNASTIIPF
jgi:spore cortex formation protein SpoVR/YcgB (stage V sporulation)